MPFSGPGLALEATGFNTAPKLVLPKDRVDFFCRNKSEILMHALSTIQALRVRKYIGPCRVAFVRVRILTNTGQHFHMVYCMTHGFRDE